MMIVARRGITRPPSPTCFEYPLELSSAPRDQNYVYHLPFPHIYDFTKKKKKKKESWFSHYLNKKIQVQLKI